MSYIKKSAVIIILSAIILLSSCQRTPDEVVVNRKDYGALLEPADGDFELIYPEKYTSSFESKDTDVSISFDADIVVPDVKKYPVVLIDPKPVTDEQIMLVADEFLEGKTGYYPERYMTKGELESRIVELKAKQNDVDALYEAYGDEEQVNAVLSNIKSRINEYSAMLLEAPESKEAIPAYMDFRPENFYLTDDYGYVSGELELTQEQLDEREANPSEHLYLVSDIELEDNKYARLNVYTELPASPTDPHHFGLFSSEHYEIHVVKANTSILEKMDYPLMSPEPFNDCAQQGEGLDEGYPKLTISLREAESIALDAMHDMGIDNYYLADSEIRKAMPSVEEYEAFWKVVMENPESDDFPDIFSGREERFYLLTFKPEYYGVPLISANSSFSQDVPTSLPFAFEKIIVRVANDSIAEFRWTNPENDLRVINEDAKLMQFDEIVKIAENHMKLKYQLETIVPVHPDMENYEEELAQYLSADVGITQIRLGLAGVPAYNNADGYMLIPVWSFYGTYGWEKTGDDDGYEYSDAVRPLASVNAVDGSIIEQVIW